MRRLSKTNIKSLLIIVLIWFSFATMMFMRGSIDKNDLKIAFGDLESWEVVNIPGNRRNIDVLTFKIKGLSDKTALYLNSRAEYESLILKFKDRKKIKIWYNDSGVAASGFNLYIYQIKYGDETLIDYENTTAIDKKVSKILFIIGFIFCLPIIYFKINQ